MKLILSIIAFVALALSSMGQSVDIYSKQIDTVLDRQYVEQKVQPNTFINDDTFIRRAYLTIIGRNPTLEEYESYYAANIPNKRQELTKFLINHPGYVSHMYNQWADMLRVRERLAPVNNFNGGPYINYIKQNIAQNKPYDQFVRDLILSSGSYYDNPQTGYYYRDLGMPLDNLIATAKVFMGTDIGCAQCHNDPFQDFTQIQFYQLAAMFTQVELRARNDKVFNERAKALREEIDTLIKADPMKNRGLNNQINNFVGATQTNLEIQPSKSLKLPHDFQYEKDGKPNEVVKPAVLSGKTVIKSEQDLRRDAVDWFVSPEHPTFTKNIVNRYWKIIFGKYIIDDYDNIYEREQLNSPLVNVLAKIFIDVKYDSKKFMHILCNTKLFHREMYSGAYAYGEKFVFIGPVKTRLSAEQLWDSVLAIAIPQPESFKTTFHEEYVKVMKTTVEELKIDTLKAKVENLNVINRNKYEKAPKYKGYTLVRASEINDESGTNNVLEQLGRSDRELIQTSSLEGSVTQVISFMNGQLAEVATNKDSLLAKTIATKSPSSRIDIIYKSILSRRPTIQELATFGGLSDDDIIWALVNTNEFKFTK